MDNQKKLKDKMIDFRNFAVVLIAISTFLYIGLLTKTKVQFEYLPVVVIGEFILIMFSFICFSISLKYKRKLQDSDKRL